MRETTPADLPSMAAPDLMPVLRRGKHRDASRGACVMEYTSVLAGEPFSDDPRCVDPELASIMRGANDKLSDADRGRLVPLLGRAIGLAVEPPPPGPRGLGRASARYRREVVAPYRERAAWLRRAATRRFADALGPACAPSARVRAGHSGGLAQLFWDTMSEPTALAESPEYVERLIDRLHVLHECYEGAMDDLGLRRTTPTACVPGRPDVTVTT